MVKDMSRRMAVTDPDPGAEAGEHCVRPVFGRVVGAILHKRPWERKDE